MRTTLLSTALPNESSGSGASITLALIAGALRDLGHEVSLCPIVFPGYETPDGADYERQLEHASSLGYRLEPVMSEAWRPTSPNRSLQARLRRAWRPHLEELYPTFRDTEAVSRAVAQLEPDAVLVYGFSALAASRAIAAPRFAATSDPPHVALWEQARRRWRDDRNPFRTAREAIAVQSMLRAYPRTAVDLLRDCEAVGAFGPQHAEWLSGLGIPCRYYRTPIADPGPPHPAEAHHPPTILLIGHLRGTATLDGFRIFRAMLPELERTLGPDGFVVRIVGGYDPPAELAGLLRHPAIRFVGFVDDVAREFERADVLLVPVSIRLGVRVRVLTGFAFGCCVVCHSANSNGIPELEHGENAMLASSPRMLAREVAGALHDLGLRERLAAGGRATYEHYFTPRAAGGALAQTLEEIASAHGQKAAG